MIKALKASLQSTDFNLKILRQSWFRQPMGVVHCGAHLAQEAIDYHNLGFTSVIWIEASHEFAAAASQTVEKYPNQRVVEAALWHLSGVQLDLRIASNGASSSLRDFADHATIFPEIETIGIEKITTTTLDDVLKDDLAEGLLVLDLQGVELEVLQGAERSLSKFEFVICEVSKREIYSNQGNWRQVSQELIKQGFTLVDWTLDPDYGYGNALYARSPKCASLHRALRVGLTLINAIIIGIKRRSYGAEQTGLITL